MEVKAYAKLNLTLDVLGKREDGFHDLKMIMQSIDLHDVLTLERNDRGELNVVTSLSFLPCGDKNLAGMAARAFYEALGRDVPGLDIRIEKHIPVCAGMAGGSTDAAAVLRGLNNMEGNPFTPIELSKIGECVGSDVPYCVLGCTALAEGRGEVLTPLSPLPECWVVVSKPDFPVSTPELFRAIDQVKLRSRPDTRGAVAALEQRDLGGVARRMYNVFEDALPERQKNRVAELKRVMIQCGALGVNMSGSGPTAFGLFDEQEKAEQGLDQLAQIKGVENFLTKTV